MKNNILFFIFGAVVGAAGGVGVSLTVIKKKMDQEMNKEKEELWAIVDKERAKNKEDRAAIQATQQELSERNLNKPSIDLFIKQQNEKVDPETLREAEESYHDYAGYSALDDEEDYNEDETEDVAVDPDIEYIEDTEYGNTPDYETRVWTFTANGVLLDDDLSPVDANEMVETIGNDFDRRIEESTDDAIYIRNNREKVDVMIQTSIQTSNELRR